MEQHHRELVDLLRKCNRCGYCQEVCPTYQVLQNEAAVARGRIQLVDLALGQPATLKADPDIASYLSSCLLCGSCVAACPSGVQTDWIIKLARNAVLPLSPLDCAKRRLLRAVFGRRVNLYRLTALLRRSDLSRRLVALRTKPLASLAAGASVLMGMERPPLGLGRRFPLRVEAPSGVDRRGAVVYFLGCSPDVFSPRTGRATLQLLSRCGWEVWVPEVTCCGAPHQVAGDLEYARHLALRNLRALTEVAEGVRAQAIVSDCPTCVTTLMGYRRLLADATTSPPALLESLDRVEPALMEVSAFLARHGTGRPGTAERPPSPPGPPLTATYHDPCHLARGLGVTEEPRRLLAQVAHLVEMDDADRCCGGAGSYGVFHPTWSRDVLAPKVAAIAATGASVVVTSCPSCVSQLNLGLLRACLPVRAVHITEFLTRGGGGAPAGR